MSKIAVVFPGQGSQKVGMGCEFYETTAVGKELFDRADALLGFPLSQLCFEGPEGDLSRTENTQPGSCSNSGAFSRVRWRVTASANIRRWWLRGS